MSHYLLVKDGLKGFRKAKNQIYRAVVRRIGVVTFFRDGLNVSKLPTRRIGRSRETPTKEFDHAVNEFGSTVFENNRRDAIRTVRLRLHRASRVESSRVKSFDVIHFDASPFTPTAST